MVYPFVVIDVDVDFDDDVYISRDLFACDATTHEYYDIFSIPTAGF